MSTPLLKDLQSQLNELQLREEELRIIKEKFEKIEQRVESLRIVISFFIVLGCFFLIAYYKYGHILFNSDLFDFFMLALYPIIFGFMFLLLFFEQRVKKLVYKISRITEVEYNNTNTEIGKYKRQIENITNKIREEKLRISYLQKLEEKKENEVKIQNVEILTSKTPEPNVEPFSSNYKPIIDKPERKIPIQEESKNNRELKFKNKLSDAVSDIEYKLIPLSEAKQLQQELEKEFNSIKIHGLFWNDSDYYFDQFEKITKWIAKYEVSQSSEIKTNTEPIILKEEPIINKIPEPKVETINPKVEPFTPTYRPISETEKGIEKNEEPIQPVETRLISNEIPVVQISQENDVKKKSNPWWNPEKVEEPIQPIETKSTDKPNLETEISSTAAEPNAEITFEDVTLQELLDKRKNKIKRPRIQSQDRQPVKRDFSTINDTRQTIGLLGEKFAIKKEIERLQKEGSSKYINEIKHVSLTDDSLGYDILSFNKDGSERYIEVKTTTGNDETPFYMSETERVVMDELPNYFIYFIYNFDTTIEMGDFTPIDCNNNSEQNLLISPNSYKVTIK